MRLSPRARFHIGVIVATFAATLAVPLPILAIPSLVLEKTVTTGSCANSSPTLTIPAPATVTYCYKITNNTSITYTTHSLVDSVLGTILPVPSGMLGPSGMLTAQQTMFINVDTMNLATWTATDTTMAITDFATDTAQVSIQSPTPTATATPTNTPTPTPTPTPMGVVITSGPTGGSTTVNITTSCVPTKIQAFDCGPDNICHNGDDFELALVSAIKLPSGQFQVVFAAPLIGGHTIYITDGCSDPLISLQVVVRVASAAPALSPALLAVLAAILSVVGLVGLGRLGWRR